jgi:hypothetical protein
MNLDEKLNALPQSESQPAERSVQPAAALTQVSIKRRKAGGAASLALPRKARKPEEGAVPAVGAASVVEVARAASPAPRHSRKSGLVFGPVPNGSAEPESDETVAQSSPVAPPAAEIAAPVEAPKLVMSMPFEPETELEIEIESDDEGQPALPFAAAQPTVEPQPEPTPTPQAEPVAAPQPELAAAPQPEPVSTPAITVAAAPVEPQVTRPVVAEVAPEVSAPAAPEVADPAPVAAAPAPTPTPVEPEAAAPAPTIPESTPAHVPLPSALSRSDAIARAVRMAALSSARSNGGNGSHATASPRVTPPAPVQPQARPAEAPRSSDLYGYWNRMKNGRRFPARGDFDANEIAENWPNSMLLTCEGQGSGISFSKILRYGGHRSRPGEEFSFTSMITEWILSIGGEVARVGRPVQDNEVFVTPDGNHSYRIVALPLGDEQSRVDHVLCHLTRA